MRRVAVLSLMVALGILGCGSAGSSTTRSTSTSHVVTSPPSATRNCFAHPGRCGFPDPASGTAGAQAPCTSLTRSGSLTIQQAGTTVKDLNVIGTLTVDASNVTITNVCVSADGGAQLGSYAIALQSGSNTLIEHSTIGGANPSNRSVEIAVRNWSGHGATLEHDDMFNCGECVYGGPWTVNDSYIISNGMRGTSDHYESVYCNNTSVTLDHDTVLNPENQVAEVFCNTNNGAGGTCSNHVSITHSLLAGGGYLVYVCGNARRAGSSTMHIADNVFARCLTGPIAFNSSQGGYACDGTRAYTAGAGADSNGFWPRGGYYGITEYTYCPPRSGQTWTGNVWDDNGAAVSCATNF